MSLLSCLVIVVVVMVALTVACRVCMQQNVGKRSSNTAAGEIVHVTFQPTIASKCVIGLHKFSTNPSDNRCTNKHIHSAYGVVVVVVVACRSRSSCLSIYVVRACVDQGYAHDVRVRCGAIKMGIIAHWVVALSNDNQANSPTQRGTTLPIAER